MRCAGRRGGRDRLGVLQNHRDLVSWLVVRRHGEVGIHVAVWTDLKIEFHSAAITRADIGEIPNLRAPAVRRARIDVLEILPRVVECRPVLTIAHVEGYSKVLLTAESVERVHVGEGPCKVRIIAFIPHDPAQGIRDSAFLKIKTASRANIHRTTNRIRVDIRRR